MMFLALFAADKTLGFVTVTNTTISIQFVTIDSAITGISEFSITVDGNKFDFKQGENKFQFDASVGETDLKKISAHFQKDIKQSITTQPGTAPTEITITKKQLLFAYCATEIGVKINYASESDNSIVITFPAGIDVTKGSLITLGSNFYHAAPSTVAGTSTITLRCPESFAQVNPTTCFDKLNGLKQAKSIQIFTTGNDRFQYEETYVSGDTLKIETNFTGGEQKIKFTTTQIIMLACICLLLVMAVVMPIVCCKSNSRKDASNKPISSGFGELRPMVAKRNTDSITIIQNDYDVSSTLFV
ncbi:hypothetical protein SS50377_23791 [Spironucleus salmonicida]|uniref:Transmembrane protein n=1 Tax=Spironucleus salmonicida TaxID=348837 RepID=V6M024_9EUKA|nr:hypothetical protein SS50377_23791 [Spironucleus salmonicida]|eukprot:EST46469.1 Hypothetical protein SS50377_13551 [Spironucleus salmonicida]